MNVVYRDPLVITYFNFVTLNYQKILWSDGCVFYSPTSSPGSSRFPPRLFAPDFSSNIGVRLETGAHLLFYVCIELFHHLGRVNI